MDQNHLLLLFSSCFIFPCFTPVTNYWTTGIKTRKAQQSKYIHMHLDKMNNKTKNPVVGIVNDEEYRKWFFFHSSSSSFSSSSSYYLAKEICFRDEVKSHAFGTQNMKK